LWINKVGLCYSGLIKSRTGTVHSTLNRSFW